MVRSDSHCAGGCSHLYQDVIAHLNLPTPSLPWCGVFVLGWLPPPSSHFSLGLAPWWPYLVPKVLVYEGHRDLVCLVVSCQCMFLRCRWCYGCCLAFPGPTLTSVGCLWHLTINWLCCLWPDSPVVASEDAGIFRAPVAPAEELSA